ncbi:MAG: hypothetical protein JO064_10060 [Actinobacteria bacterium]|nr:hypothetical protein [Actinomycetota bacterium]
MNRRALASLAAALVALLLASVAAQGAAVRTSHTARALGATTESSTNWAGYAVTGSDASPISFTSVTGTWSQAAATCSPGDGSSASAVWVGLGGYSLSSQALEQIGTDADCNANGPASYYAWYELVPSPPVNLTLKIDPGDVITTSVNINGNNVLLQLKDRTRHTTFTKRITTSVTDISSAEWIAEAPSSCTDYRCDPLPLADFGSVTFSHIATIGNAHPGTLTDPTWTLNPIQLVPDARGGFGFFPGPDRGYTRYASTAGTSAPAALTTDGRSFSLTWLSDPSASAGG